MAVAVCAVLAMVLGFIWYGPLFGKRWMKATGMDTMDPIKQKEMQKKSMPLYLVQFALALFQAFVLAWYVGTLNSISSGVHTAFSIWLAFIIPTLASSVMWTADNGKVKWTKFVLQAGYQLALFFIFGTILGMWM